MPAWKLLGPGLQGGALLGETLGGLAGIPLAGLQVLDGGGQGVPVLFGGELVQADLLDGLGDVLAPGQLLLPVPGEGLALGLGLGQLLLQGSDLLLGLGLEGLHLG